MTQGDQNRHQVGYHEQKDQNQTDDQGPICGEGVRG